MTVAALDWLPRLLPWLLAGALYAAGHHHGTTASERRWLLRQQQEQASQLHAMRRAREREAALTERLARADAALARQAGTLARQQRQLATRISDADTRDGPRFTGLGPDGLRLYRQLLGYPAAVPATPAAATATTTETASAPGGLPPAPLLAHAADYGQWCQQLAAQLSALRAYYLPEGETP